MTGYLKKGRPQPCPSVEVYSTLYARKPTHLLVSMNCRCLKYTFFPLWLVLSNSPRDVHWLFQDNHEQQSLWCKECLLPITQSALAVPHTTRGSVIITFYSIRCDYCKHLKSHNTQLLLSQEEVFHQTRQDLQIK